MQQSSRDGRDDRPEPVPSPESEDRPDVMGGSDPESPDLLDPEQ